MQPRLTLLGPVNSYTGYGTLTIQLAREIERLSGAFVSIRSLSSSEAFGATIPMDVRERLVVRTQPEPWEFLHHPPNYTPTPGKMTAWLTMGESTRLRPREVALLNQAYVIINPSRWGADCFSASGVDTRIRVVPLGFNPDIFKYRATPPTERSKCVFGAAGRTAHGGARKGIDDVIRAFLEAFPTQQDVELRVKVFPDCKVVPTSDPRIKILAAYISDQQMSDWLSGLDCFVSCARGEGFGLIQLQAMATGVPVACVNWSGLTEFFRPELGYALKYNLEPASGFYSGAGAWAMPHHSSVVAAMQDVYKDRWGAYLKGAQASVGVQHLTLENSMRGMIEVLKEVGAL